MLLSELATPDVGILGTGREGLSAWRRLRARYPRKKLVLYSETEPGEEVRELLDPQLDVLRIGSFSGQDLATHDVLVRSPGISPYRRVLQAAHRAGVRFTTASNIWFAEHPQAKTICITGTKGKSTTTALTAHLLNASGLKAVAAGNIGRPMLAMEDSEPDWWVIELSSYQLADLEARPTIGAILNLSDEHLDWHGSPESYQRDKLRLAELCDGNTLVADHQDTELKALLSGRPGLLWFNHRAGYHVEDGRLMNGPDVVPGLPVPAMPGHHNLSNLAAALTLAEAAGTRVQDPARALESFAGLPHRLKIIGALNRVQYVDDSLATTPVATLAALEAFGGSPVTLLVGGLDRGLDWRRHADRIMALNPHAIIGMPDNGPDITGVLRDSGLSPPGGMHGARDLADAVRLAMQVTPPGGVVLLSPGAPSFPRFADYRDRGLQFARLAGFCDGQ